MAITLALVAQFADRLRYLCTQDGNPGTSVTLPNSGGVTPDLQTDTAVFRGPLFSIARSKLLGHGTITAGTPLTQAQARAVLMEDGTVSVGNARVSRARSVINLRAGAVITWLVDADVDGAGNPVLTIASSAQTASTAYLDVLVAGSGLNGG